MGTNLPPGEQSRKNVIAEERGRIDARADLLRLIGDVRRLAFDPALPNPVAVQRIRDRFGEYESTLSDE